MLWLIAERTRMDWLTFISSLVSSLAWPATVIVAFFLLKNNLGSLFPFIEKLKYKDFELEFRKSIEKLVEKSKTAIPAPTGETLSSPALQLQDRLFNLAEISSRSAILEAWLQVESAAADVIESKKLTTSFKRTIAPLRFAELLSRNEILNSSQMEIFHQLRELRNKAVHIGDATFKLEEVTEYIDLALSLASEIRRKISHNTSRST